MICGKSLTVPGHSLSHRSYLHNTLRGQINAEVFCLCNLHLEEHSDLFLKNLKKFEISHSQLETIFLIRGRLVMSGGIFGYHYLMDRGCY